MNDMIPSEEDLRTIIESHEQIDTKTCVYMTMELVLQLLGIKPIGYRELQESHRGIEGFGKDFQVLSLNSFQQFSDFPQFHSIFTVYLI